MQCAAIAALKIDRIAAGKQTYSSPETCTYSSPNVHDATHFLLLPLIFQRLGSGQKEAQQRRTLKILASNIKTKLKCVELFLVGITLLLRQLERVRLRLRRNRAFG